MISEFLIRHVWHEDAGFQKCGILNKALLSAHGDYVVFTERGRMLRL